MQALPSSLPTASTLHLLTIQALVCSGEHDHAEQLCSQLVETLQPPVELILARRDSENGVEGTRHVLALAQALCFQSSAAVELKRAREARLCCGR